MKLVSFTQDLDRRATHEILITWMDSHVPYATQLLPLFFSRHPLGFALRNLPAKHLLWCESESTLCFASEGRMCLKALGT
jgi:hypothetical protein